MNEDNLASGKITMGEGCTEDLLAKDKDTVLFRQDEVAILK